MGGGRLRQVVAHGGSTVCTIRAPSLKYFEEIYPKKEKGLKLRNSMHKYSATDYYWI